MLRLPATNAAGMLRSRRARGTSLSIIRRRRLYLCPDSCEHAQEKEGESAQGMKNRHLTGGCAQDAYYRKG